MNRRFEGIVRKGEEAESGSELTNFDPDKRLKIMKIKRLSFTDHARGLTIEPIEFNDRMNLLVGASGAGKTQILKALMTLKEIAEGGAYSGIKWELEFEAFRLSLETINSPNQIITWKGQFEVKGVGRYSTGVKSYQNENMPNLVYEQIILDHNKVVIDRTENYTTYNDNVINVTLLKSSSIIRLISEELFFIIRASLSQIIYVSFSGFYGTDVVSSTLLSHKDINDIDELSSSLRGDLLFLYALYGRSANAQLYGAYLRLPETFKKISDTFNDIFPEIESIKYDLNKDKLITSSGTDSIQTELHIKHINSDNWIAASDISSGMLHVLYLITIISIAPEMSVILIDEFENSLGANCIDEITDFIKMNRRGLQLIITSHHPYIINNIPFEYWKIVTRNGGNIHVDDASEYPQLGRSHHEHFMQLIQLKEFRTGSKEVS